MKKLGLLGKNISYSFSRNYFNNKFKNEQLEDQYHYDNFDIQNINEFNNIIKNTPALIGLNVTIPYKEVVIPFLDDLSNDARTIGAVNTIKITTQGKLIGHNTDYFGFTQSILPLLKTNHTKALVLGTGGAAKAVVFALSKLGIQSKYVSRESKQDSLTYQELDNKIFEEYSIVINCTPLGTSPNTEKCPDVPYQYFTPQHIAFDLIYNPEKTTFLQKAQFHGAVIKNGYDMLVFQAEKAWETWME